MDKIIDAISQINKIYGDTESMEGTYKHFLDIKHEAEYLEKENVKLKKAINILKNALLLEVKPHMDGKSGYIDYYLYDNDLMEEEYGLLKEVLEND